MQKRRKKKKKKVKSSLITVELSAIVLIAVYLTGYMVSALTKPTVATEVVSYGQIESPKEFTGIIARDEIVTYAQSDGTAFYNYAENEYVRKGSVVCVTKHSDDSDIIEKQINLLSDDILQKQELRNDSAVYLDEVKRINSRIQSEIDGKVPYFHTFNGDDMYRLKYQLQKDISARNTIRITNGSNTLSGLNDKIDAYERRLMDGSQSYEANVGGVVSYNIDGFENEITPETIFNVTKSQIERSAGEPVRISGDRQVSTGGAVFKIVASNTWFVGAYLESSIVKDWQIGGMRNLYVKDGRTTRKLTLKVADITQHGDDSYVVFSTSKFMTDFINMRTITFTLDDGTFKGLKVPNTAVIEKTAVIVPTEFIYDFRGIRGVYVKNGTDFLFTSVVELSFSSGMANVLQDFNGVQIGTTVYSRNAESGVIGENSFDIKDIVGTAGVYVANSGAAEFKQINILAKNEFYSIISKNSPNGIKPYDRIITDAGSVDNNTIIRK